MRIFPPFPVSRLAAGSEVYGLDYLSPSGPAEGVAGERRVP